MNLKNLTSKIILFLIDSIRPLLGPGGVCIYPVTCRQFAKETLNKKPLLFAIPLIVLRLISCNPLTALFFRIKEKY